MELCKCKNKILINKIEFIDRLIIFSFLFIASFSPILLLDNSIALKITKGGDIYIFNNNQISTCKYTGPYPIAIYINGDRQDAVKSQYSFSASIDNVVILNFGSKIITTSCLFSNCTNITEIDLSNFDSSDVQDTSYMFDHCTSLYN